MCPITSITSYAVVYQLSHVAEDFYVDLAILVCSGMNNYITKALPCLTSPLNPDLVLKKYLNSQSSAFNQRQTETSTNYRPTCTSTVFGLEAMVKYFIFSTAFITVARAQFTGVKTIGSKLSGISTIYVPFRITI